MTDDAAMPFLLHAAFTRLTDRVHARLAEHGYPEVRVGHGFALQAIGGGCTSVQLGERLGVSKQAAAKTVQNLEAMGFVERTASPTDRRERIVTITARGAEMLRLSGRFFREEVAGWRRDLGDQRVDALLATLPLLTRD